ncbi:MAG: DUF2336 domain-containing protein [Pseudomonadota bacterium]
MIIRRFLTWIEAAPADQRADAANALARAYLESELTPEDREIADAALTLLLDDPSPDVRLGLARAVGPAPNAPHHIIVALAEDRADIAALVLAQSPLILDIEAIDWLGRGEPLIERAIASRRTISTELCDALCAAAGERAIVTLLENPGVTYTAKGLLALSRRLGRVAAIRTMLLDIKTLPTEAREVLLHHHAEQLGALVLERGWLGSDAVSRITSEAVEKGTTTLVSWAQEDELDSLIDHLMQEQRLTAAFMLRSLCSGNIDLFERTMARLVGVDQRRMRSIVRSGNLSAFSAAYTKSSLPNEAFDVFAAALSVTCQWHTSPHITEVRQLPRRIMEEILARCGGAPEGASINSSMRLLRRLAADAARDSARNFAQAVAKADVSAGQNGLRGQADQVQIANAA